MIVITRPDNPALHGFSWVTLKGNGFGDGLPPGIGKHREKRFGGGCGDGLGNGIGCSAKKFASALGAGQSQSHWRVDQSSDMATLLILSQNRML